MSSSSRFTIFLIVVGLFISCTESLEPSPILSSSDSTSKKTCIDQDGDGYGQACPGGTDCDDTDPEVTDECVPCPSPAQGCPCAPGQKPIECFLNPTQEKEGQITCHAGTRFCRDSKWTDCLSIQSYIVPSNSNSAALIDPDAGAPNCHDCLVNCYRIDDPLDPLDGGLNDANTEGPLSWADGGGITLTPQDAGPDTGSDDPESEDCTPGASPDIDCDGIPDEFDPYPDEPPFQTDNETIFLQLGPGQTGTGSVDIEFFVNNVDIYFLLDQTGSMADERVNLHAGLTSGTFLGDDVECADYDFDGQPNNELKSQGIIGAIRCLIRDAWFGAGFHRELPFSNYGNDDEVIFRHFQDITGGVSSVLNAINQMQNDGNIDWPEGHSQALYSIATGNGLYLGYDRPGVSPRTDCPSETWGYPCFRDSSIPIIILFTDAPFHNGPDPSYDYPNSFWIESGTTSVYIAVPSSNESFDSIFDLGDVTDSYITYTGDTQDMYPDLPGSLVDCGADDDANDAVFQFEITQPQSVTIDASGSAYDTVMSLHSGIPVFPSSPVDVDGNPNHLSPYSVGDVYDGWFIGRGNTDSMGDHYQGTVVSCDANSYADDAVFAFSLSEATDVSIDTEGSGFDTAISLHRGPIPLRPDPIAVSNSNDTIDSAYSIGDMLGEYKVFEGNTNAGAIQADYDAESISCSAHDDADDAVYSFSLSQATRLRIDTEDSGYDTVISVHDGPIATPTTSTASGKNEDVASAFEVGDVANRWVQVHGDTQSMEADFSGSYVGCSANDGARDAVVSFSLSEQATLQIDTEESCYDTVISLHQGLGGYASELDITVPANYDNDTHLTAYDLGDLYRSYFDFQGGSIAPANSDYLNSIIGCDSGDDTPDIAFQFSLSQGTNVRIDASNSPFDNVISIHDGDIPIGALTSVDNSNEDEMSAYDVGSLNGQYRTFSGDTGGMDPDYDGSELGCGANDDANDGVYRFTLSSQTEVQIDTEGSSYDTVIGLFEDSITSGGGAPSRPSASWIGTSNETRWSAYDVGTVDNQWKVVSGSTHWMSDDWGKFGCSSHQKSRDAFVSFTLNSQQTVTIDTDNSLFDTVIGLYKGSNFIACNRDGGSTSWTSSLTRLLNAGTYYVVIKGDEENSKGYYELSIRDDSLMSSGGSGALECDDNSGSGNTSRIDRTLDAGTYYLVVKGQYSSSEGDYRITFQDVTNPPQANQVACANGPDNSSVIETWLDAGSYYLILKAAEGSNGANYKIVMQDLDVGGGTRLDCDRDSGSDSMTSSMTNTLDPGNYYVVVKGDHSDSRGCYLLNIRDVDSGSHNRLFCDNDSGPGSTSRIEEDFDAGTYYVVVKGDASSSQGNYTLTLRDVDSHPDNRLSCDNDSGSGSTSSLSYSLDAGDYYVVVKGDNSSSGGEYRISIKDEVNAADKRIECDDDDGQGYTSKITRDLDTGTYYVVLKGYDSDDQGPYQLTMGTGSTSWQKFEPIPWSTTRDALQDRGIRMMSVLSCHDDPGNSSECNRARDQAQEIAELTDALGENQTPLVMDIDRDGSGLSLAVVEGVKSLANYISMDVSARVVFTPDDNPGFVVSAEAVDNGPGDGCDPPIGIEHQNCLPGSVPQFRFTFTNPSSAPVPLNPNDPKGGYNFRVELIGDAQYLLDTVPVYIIPEPPVNDVFYESASYWQNIQADECIGTQRPDWSDLTWSSEMPQGTSIEFEACASDLEAELDECVYSEVATVTASGLCNSDADCINGTCAANNVCNFITAKICSQHADCHYNASCTSGSCTYSEQPANISTGLGTSNFRFHMRMKVTLNPDSTQKHAPILRDWSTTFVCTEME